VLVIHRFFPTLAVGLLLFMGVAQAQNNQGGTNSQSFEMEAGGGNYLQPLQPCLNADQHREGIKGSLQEERYRSSKPVNETKIKPNVKDKNRKVAGAENIISESDLSRPSFGKNRGSITQNMGPHVGGGGSLSTIRGSMQSGGLGSSFLDGYLLKSLQDKGIERKKETKEEESKDNLPQRVKRAF
jgi:hypothetical protein